MRFNIVSLIAVAGLVAACGTTPTTQSGTAGGSGASTGAVSIAPGSQEDLTVNVGDRVFFDFDKYNLKNEARAVLGKQAAWMKSNSNVKVIIEGHCDERGTREYNIALGHRRANAVYDYLLTQGVSAGQMATTSYGKERPVDPASNDAAWAKNRRAVTMVIN
ncbi:peptidoglycan-associated lipoprotein Pal [Pseudomonadota bacterium]